MANPQTENGFLKIANELFEAIMQHDFSKRQRAILDFIIRLSYGCQRKNAIIPKRVFFERLLGIDNSDVTRELKKLASSHVIKISACKKFYSLNKDYEQWAIKKIKKYDQEQINELIKAQLIPDYEPAKKVGKTPTKKAAEKVGKTPTKQETENKKVGKTPTIYNRKVGKTPTIIKKKWVKHPHIERASLTASWDRGPRKDIKYKDITNIKDINLIDKAAADTNIKDNIEPGPLAQDPKIGDVFIFFADNIKDLTPHYSDRVNAWLEDHNPDLVLHVFKHALEVTKYKEGSPLKLIDKIFKRVREKNIKTVAEFEAAEQEREKQQERQNQTGRRSNRTEIIPDWLKEEDPPPVPEETSAAEIEERKRRLEEKLKKYTQRETEEAAAYERA